MNVVRKNAVITGASRGVGKAITERFAAEGINVWACASAPNTRFEDEMSALAAKYNVWIKPVYFDLSDQKQIKSAASMIMGEKLPIDYLINNAGVEQSGAFFQMTTIDEMHRIFDINFFGQIALTQYLSKTMCRKKSGSIVFMASIAGMEAHEGYIAYSASKAALISAAKTISVELAQFNIRVNTIAPSLVDTDMLFRLTKKAQDGITDSILMKRVATPEEIANVVYFLSSDESSYITGQVIRVDGGKA